MAVEQAYQLAGFRSSRWRGFLSRPQHRIGNVLWHEMMFRPLVLEQLEDISSAKSNPGILFDLGHHVRRHLQQVSAELDGVRQHVMVVFTRNGGDTPHGRRAFVSSKVDANGTTNT